MADQDGSFKLARSQVTELTYRAASSAREHTSRSCRLAVVATLEAWAFRHLDNL